MGDPADTLRHRVRRSRRLLEAAREADIDEVDGGGGTAGSETGSAPGA